MLAALHRHIKRSLSEKRMLHVFAVEELSVQLAQRFSVNQEEARLAALGHDLLREHSAKQLLSLARKASLEWLVLYQETPMLLHGPLAHMELNKWSAVSEQVSHAMHVHTLGESKMSKLAKILYCADYLEPLRSYLEKEQRQKLLMLPLEEMFASVAKQRCNYYIQQNQALAAPSKRMLNELCN